MCNAVVWQHVIGMVCVLLAVIPAIFRAMLLLREHECTNVVSCVAVIS